MRQRASEHGLLRPLRVDVDVLVIPRKIRKGVDLLLRDLHPLPYPQFLTDQPFEFLDALHFARCFGNHRYSPCSRSRPNPLAPFPAREGGTPVTRCQVQPSPLKHGDSASFPLPAGKGARGLGCPHSPPPAARPSSLSRRL